MANSLLLGLLFKVKGPLLRVASDRAEPWLEGTGKQSDTTLIWIPARPALLNWQSRSSSASLCRVTIKQEWKLEHKQLFARPIGSAWLVAPRAVIFTTIFCQLSTNQLPSPVALWLWAFACLQSSWYWPVWPNCGTKFCSMWNHNGFVHTEQVHSSKLLSC